MQTKGQRITRKSCKVFRRKDEKKKQKKKVQRIGTGLEATGWEGSRETAWHSNLVLVTLRFRGGSSVHLSRSYRPPGCSLLVHLTCT